MTEKLPGLVIISYQNMTKTTGVSEYKNFITYRLANLHSIIARCLSCTPDMYYIFALRDVNKRTGKMGFLLNGQNLTLNNVFFHFFADK